LEQQFIVHELQSSPQQSEHFSPHLQSADFFESVAGVEADSEPIANTPAKRNANIAVFI
jgi:hypothetical protein